SGDPGWVAELLSGRAEARAQSGAVALAVADLERAVVLLEGTEHRAYLVTTRRRLGGVLRAAKEPAKALVVLQRCVADAEALGDPATLAAALGELAGAAVDLGDLAAANAALERGVAAYVAAHDAEGAFVLRRERVGVMATRGEGVRAQALVEAEIAAAEAAGDRGGAAAHLELLAALCQQLGDAARAEDALRRALASYEGLVAAGVPGATRALAEAFAAAAGLSEQAGRLLTARAQRERAIEAYDAAGDAAGAVGARVALALLETRLGDAKAAVARLEPLLATLPEGAGGDAVANVRQALATAWLAAGERAKAAALFEDVRRAHVAAGRVLDAIRARADLGQAFADAGEYGRAIEALAAARAEAEALPRPEPSVVAIIRARLGSTQYLAGFYPDALEHLEAARAAQVALGERVNAASSISNLGLVHAAFGQLDEAIRAHETGRAMQEAMGNRADAAASGFNIGQVLRRRGDLAKAVSWFERVEAEYAAMGRPADVATVLLVRASIAAMLDDPASSRALEARAIELLRGCGDTLGLELAELDAAGRALDDGDAAASLATYERAHAAEEARGARVSAAETLRFMGYALTELGRHAEALETIERSRVAFEAIGDRRGVAQARQAAGLALEAKGDLAAARAAFEEALTLQDDLGDRPEAAGTLSFLARVQARAGAPAEAMDAARRCIDLAALTTRGLGAEEGVGGRRVIGLASAVGARAAVSVGDVAALLFFLESGRAGALLEGLEARETLWAAAVPAPLRAEEADARAAEALALAAFRRAADDGDRAAARAAKAEVEAARLRLSAAVARIQREAKAGADLLYPRTITLPALQGALAAGEAFVAYALLEGDAVALVVTSADARIVGLGPTKTIVETVEGLALDDASSDPAGGLAALASRVVGPLGLPPAVTRVLVSPSGALAHVPFAALLPDRTVAYAPSGTTHAFLRRDEGLRGEGVLALGDPAYDEGARSAGAVGRGGLRLVRLPGTAVEATALGTRVLLGPDATEPALVAALATRPRWRALHLACHGLVDPDRPAFSSLALTPSAGDDGLLTALEVFRTHVAADLVVLSACETGKGKIFEGEGLVGLARAFMFAGAPRVVCSLWKVDDDATRALMTRFYELWNPKPSSGVAPVPAAEALRQAQAFVRAQPRWRHPFYWAAWVLWGPPS
ncbi:MAG: CHAT domain-containing protein, partial [Planctomycetia bacterium]|nr:CHAT domain-containing protein [Planctomycetia bacterium]